MTRCPTCLSPMSYDTDHYVCPCCPTKIYVKEVKSEPITFVSTAPSELPAHNVPPD